MYYFEQLGSKRWCVIVLKFYTWLSMFVKVIIEISQTLPQLNEFKDFLNLSDIFLPMQMFTNLGGTKNIIVYSHQFFFSPVV